MSDLLREVDEMMKQERVERFWKENSTLIVTIIAALILGTAGVSGYKSWNQGVQEKQTTALIEAIEGENFPEDLEGKFQDSRQEVKKLALLIGAGTYQDQGDTEKALDLYKKAASFDANPELQGLAMLMQIRLDQELNSDEKTELLDQIIFKKGPWTVFAQFEKALIETENNNYDKALEHLNAVLASQAVPQSLLGKAHNLKHVLVLKLAKQKENQDES